MNEVENSSYDRYEIENLIDRWIFDEKDRKILKRKFLDNAPLEKIAEEIGMSDRQTKRRFNRAKLQLFKHI